MVFGALWFTLRFMFTSGAVRKNLNTCYATDAEVEKCIKDWLKYATDRDGGRKGRTSSKKADENCPQQHDEPSGLYMVSCNTSCHDRNKPASNNLSQHGKLAPVSPVS